MTINRRDERGGACKPVEPDGSDNQGKIFTFGSQVEGLDRLTRRPDCEISLTQSQICMQARLRGKPYVVDAAGLRDSQVVWFLSRRGSVRGVHVVLGEQALGHTCSKSWTPPGVFARVMCRQTLFARTVSPMC